MEVCSSIGSIRPPGPGPVGLSVGVSVISAYLHSSKDHERREACGLARRRREGVLQRSAAERTSTDDNAARACGSRRSSDVEEPDVFSVALDEPAALLDVL